MRDNDQLDVAKQALENRLEEYDHPLLLAFNVPKRDVVVAVLHGDDDPGEIVNAMEARLRSQEMDLASYVQVQAAKNAAEWVQAEHDSI